MQENYRESEYYPRWLRLVLLEKPQNCVLFKIHYFLLLKNLSFLVDILDYKRKLL